MADKDKPKAKAKDTAPKGRVKAVAPEAWPPLIGMTVDETAAALRTDDKTVRKLIQAGSIPARIVGRGYRIDPDALRAWIASGMEGRLCGRQSLYTDGPYNPNPETPER